MKCIFAKSELQEVLAKLQGLTQRKTSFFISSSIKLSAEDDNYLTVEASDLETYFIGKYPAIIEKKGEICINSRKFYEIVKNYPEEKIILNEIEDKWIEIGEGRLLFHIVGMNPEEFSSIVNEHFVVEDKDYPFISMDSSIFKKLIEKNLVIPAQADEKIIYNKVIFFESFKDEEEKKYLRAVSTDSKRMIKYDILSDLDFSFEEKGVLIPKKSLSELLKFFDIDESIKIGSIQNKFIIIKNSEKFLINLFEEDFPPYQNLLNYNKENYISLKRSSFLESLRRMSILSDNDYRSIVFSFEKDKLILRASNPDLGESREEIDIIYEREAFETAFNPRFFIDALSVVEEEEVHIHIHDNKSPCTIKGAENEHLISIIMPIRM